MVNITQCLGENKPRVCTQHEPPKEIKDGQEHEGWCLSKKSQFLAQLLILSWFLNQGALLEGEAGVTWKKNPITYM